VCVVHYSEGKIEEEVFPQFYPLYCCNLAMAEIVGQNISRI